MTDSATEMSFTNGHSHLDHEEVAAVSRPSNIIMTDNMERQRPHAQSMRNKLLDIFGTESDSFELDIDPTIIDAFNTFLRRCCCCCRCVTKRKSPPFEDEVAKALNSKSKRSSSRQKIAYDLKTGLMASGKNSPQSSLVSSAAAGTHKNTSMRCYCIPCLRYRPSILQLIAASVVLQTMAVALMGSVALVVDVEDGADYKVFAQVLLACLWFFQLMLIIQLMVTTVKKLWFLRFFQIFALYLTSLLLFTGAYATAYFYDFDDQRQSRVFAAFNLQHTQFAAFNFMQRMAAFFYFSCSQQTLCGICEISPKSPPTYLVAGLQMGVGVFFGIVIVSIAISRLGEDVEARYRALDREKRLKPVTAFEDASMMQARGDSRWSRLIRNQRLIAFRRAARKYLLLIVILMQLAKNVLEWLTTSDSYTAHRTAIRASLFMLFDVANVAMVLMTSLKFVHIGHMTELSLGFLCQTYLSVVLTFTSIYIDIQVSSSALLASDSYAMGAFLTGETTFYGMWTKFSYFSFAIMTLNGSGLDIKPIAWYACLVVCAQMLLGVLFHVYIFGIGLLIIANKKNKSSNKHHPKVAAHGQASNDHPRSHAPESDQDSSRNVGSELIMSALLHHQNDYDLL